MVGLCSLCKAHGPKVVLLFLFLFSFSNTTTSKKKRKKRKSLRRIQSVKKNIKIEESVRHKETRKKNRIGVPPTVSLSCLKKRFLSFFLFPNHGRNNEQRTTNANYVCLLWYHESADILVLFVDVPVTKCEHILVKEDT